MNDKKRLKKTFIKKDLKYLKKKHHVYIIKDLPNLTNILRVLSSLIKIYKYRDDFDIVFGWWLYNYPAILIKKLFKIPLIIISGGNDTTCIMKYNYGSFCDLKQRLIIKFNLKFIDLICFVDESLEQQLKSYINETPNFKIIPTCFDEDFWKPETYKRKGILTVALNNFEKKMDFLSRHFIKGIDRFIKLASLIPDEEFTLVGYNKRTLKEVYNKIPSNLNVLGTQNKKELRKLYQKNSIYCQFSRHEGFPNVMGEAILCGCYAIGSNVNGIPKLINNPNYIFNFNDLSVFSNIIKIVNKINKKITPNNIGRNYIIEKYTEKKRINELDKIINDMTE